MPGANSQERRRHPRLLEVVLIVFILAIAAGMFLPMLHRAHDGPSPGARCLSNLKQIALALKQYTGDYGEWYPPGAATEADNHWRELGRLHPQYASSVSIFFCPQSRDVEWTPRDVGKRDDQPIPKGKAISYAYAMDGSDPDVLRALKESMPSSVKVVADKPCAVAATRSGPNRGNHGIEGRNVAFLDGSGKWISRPEPLDVADDDPAEQKGTRWWSDPPSTR